MLSVKKYQPNEIIDFLSIELTSQCNLQCSHCYASAGPFAGKKDVLKKLDYELLIEEGFELGSRKIQFIGGEPLLNKDLPYFVSLAKETGYEFIEVFSNLTNLTDELILCFKDYGVHVATSMYSPTEQIHDEITHVKGSFYKTIRSIKKLISNGIDVRVGIIEMNENNGLLEETKIMLNELGVVNVGGDRIREVGRGDSGTSSDLEYLCGGCNGKTLSVSPDGLISPCILSKKMAVGSYIGSSLSEAVESEKLVKLKEKLYSENYIQDICTPKTCNPYDWWDCAPKRNNCVPCYPKG